MCKDGCLSSIEEVSLLRQCGSVTLFKSRGNLGVREFAFHSDSAHNENWAKMPHKLGSKGMNEASSAEQVNE